MIYTAPVNEITWATVEKFCEEGIVEGAFLDYKADFPADLARTVAAMANTLGGIVLIGVEETVEGKPKLPLSGIAMERGLAERVTNIVLTNITPPLFPEVSVLPNDGGQKAVVVIRIAQSPMTPHAIRGNTRVYLRTGNRNNPEELATLDQIYWLQSKRANSLSLRSRLYADAYGRSDIEFGHVDRSQGVRIVNSNAQTANLSLSVVPTFPAQQYKSPPELRSLLRNIRVKDYYGTDDMFPLGGSNATLLQNGVFLGTTLQDEKGKRSYYTELNGFGQLFYRQTLATKINNNVPYSSYRAFLSLGRVRLLREDFFCSDWLPWLRSDAV